MVVSNILEDLYGSEFDNIAPFVAMIVEDDVPGSQLGEVAGKVIAYQYNSLRSSDPCHYEYIFTRDWVHTLADVTFKGISSPAHSHDIFLTAQNPTYPK